jgi:tetratricopeptide (TPR) repeat protein
MNPLMRRLYTEEEIREKIQKCEKKHRDSEAREYYQGMINATYTLALIYKILENGERSRHYLKIVVSEWDQHPDRFAESKYINALMKLGRSRKALDEIIKNPGHWAIETLAYAYEEAGRKNEATLLYSGLAMHAFELYRFSPPFWRPHLLQKTSDLWEKVECEEWATSYNMRALQAWKEVKDNINKKLELIEEAWLHEEVAYIYERAQRFDEAFRYYRKAQGEYETAHKKEPVSIQANYCDGDGDRYYDFFSWQIPDLPYIHLSHDNYEENDLRRMRYHFLNLEQKARAT